MLVHCLVFVGCFFMGMILNKWLSNSWISISFEPELGGFRRWFLVYYDHICKWLWAMFAMSMIVWLLLIGSYSTIHHWRVEEIKAHERENHTGS